MQKWEYKIIEFKNANQNEIAGELRNAGDDGWELVSATSSFNIWLTKIVNRMFLKRPVS